MSTVIKCLAVATVLRIALGFIQKDVWKIKPYKYFIFVPLMSVAGILTSKAVSYIAYGTFAGNRLYGTVIGVAIFAPIFAILLMIPISDLYGFSSLGTWLSIAVMKVSCIIDGCCYGRVLSTGTDGSVVRFPSQIAELVVAALFFVWFFILAQKGKYPHALFYPLLMIWYGIYRYAFDWFRGDPVEQKAFVAWIPAGRFFSILIFIAGVVSMILLLKKKYPEKFTAGLFFKSLIGRVE